MSDNVRVYEIAEEAGATSAEVVKKAKNLGIELKSAQSQVSFSDAEEITTYIMTGKSSKLKVEKQEKVKPSVIKKDDEAVEKKQVDVDIKKDTSEKTKELEGQKSSLNVKEEKNDNTILAKAPIDNKQSVPAVNTPTTLNKSPIRIIPKKRGLKIVKKLKPKIINKPIVDNLSEENKQMKSLSEIFGSTSSKQNISLGKDLTSKVKKDKKRQIQKVHEHGKIINISLQNNKKEFINNKTSNNYDSLLGEEVFLLDIVEADKSKLLEDTKPRNTSKQTRSSKPSAFGNRPQGLKRKKRKKRFKKDVEVEDIKFVSIPEDVRVYEFAQACGKSASEVISVLFGLGMLVTKNDFLQQDELEILGEEFDIEVTVKDALEEVNYMEEYQEEKVNEENLTTRPPIVTIMGHVDHGKTSLLDKIRSTKVSASEAGGITQHISAYTITQNNKDITFIDTPGHAAFSAMRARGAQITDIIIIVVAADDGVKPQTLEVIAHAKQSKCPIIVAINKIDKESANIDMVKSQMAEHDMTPVDWGGDVEFIGVSAISGAGIDDLLENILLQSEMLELQADPSAKAKAVVIESLLEKGRGVVATVIVQNGTLSVGDNIVCDTTYGRVKALSNDKGQKVQTLNLSQVGNVLGLNIPPMSGSIMVVQDTEKEAKDIATTRAEHARLKELSKSTKVTLEEMSGLIAEGKIKQLPVIIKTDVSGSLEAIKGSLEKIANEEVKVKVLHAGVGGITESDLILAGASNGCIILGFNVRPTGAVKSKAKADGIPINTYTIIYDLIDDVKDSISGLMSAKVREENTGQAEVRDTFVVPKIGTVAGCLVTDSKVIKGGLARIIRDGVIVYTGKISSLKRFKDDVKEVANGYECGIMFEKFNDIKVGDFIETFIEIQEKVHIDD